MKFPIVAFTKNIIFNIQGKAYAIYKLEPMPWDFFPVERRESAVRSMESIISSFEGSGQILLLWEDLILNENSYFERNIGISTDDDFRDELARHTKAAKSAITQGAKLLHRYILLELSTVGSVGNFQDFLIQARDSVLKAMMAIRPLLPDSVRQHAESAEKELYGRLQTEDVHRISFRDLDFIIRKTVFRSGVLPAPLPERQGGMLTPAAITAFSDGAVINESINYVSVDNNGDEQYQTFLHFTDIPAGLHQTGIDLFNINPFTFSFDTVIHFTVMPPHRARQKTETKRRLLTAQMQEAYGSGEMAGITEEGGLADSRGLEAKLEEGKSLASVAVCLALSCSDRKELNSRAHQLRNHYLARNFRAVRPSSKQLESLLSFLPGAKSSAPYIECDPGYIAAMGPSFAIEVGDPSGFFIGWSGHTPVFWHPGRAAQELDKTNAAIVSGSLGGGKSVLLKLLAYLTMLKGGYVLAIDPKGEYWPFKKLFKDKVKIVDLSPRGGVAINPFVFSDDDITSISIAQNYLTLALNATGKENRILAISQALERLYQMPTFDRYMENFINKLQEIVNENSYDDVQREARLCISLLESMRRTNIGRMVFGRDSISLFGEKEKMVVVNIKEIPRPDPETDPSRYTENEKQGIAIIYLITAITREAAFGLPKNIVKLFAIDEAWVVVSISEGQNLLAEIIRMGRSFNLIPFLISQNVTDLDKPVFKNNISQVFCFRAQSAEESKACLRLLGADENAVLSETFSRLTAGQCLFKDNEGRVGWLKVEVVPHYLINTYFNSSPIFEMEG